MKYWRMLIICLFSVSLVACANSSNESFSQVLETTNETEHMTDNNVSEEAIAKDDVDEIIGRWVCTGRNDGQECSRNGEEIVFFQ